MSVVLSRILSGAIPLSLSDIKIYCLLYLILIAIIDIVDSIGTNQATYNVKSHTTERSFNHVNHYQQH